jgi:predicted small secreted protein
MISVAFMSVLAFSTPLRSCNTQSL